MISQFQNLFILIGIIALAGLGYYLFIQKDAVTLNNEQIDNQISIDTSEFLHRLNHLKTIQLDGAILKDNRFLTLIDFSDDVAPVPIGRSNPFVHNN